MSSRTLVTFFILILIFTVTVTIVLYDQFFYHDQPDTVEPFNLTDYMNNHDFRKDRIDELRFAIDTVD